RGARLLRVWAARGVSGPDLSAMAVRHPRYRMGLLVRAVWLAGDSLHTSALSSGHQSECMRGGGEWSAAADAARARAAAPHRCGRTFHGHAHTRAAAGDVRVCAR